MCIGGYPVGILTKGLSRVSFWGFLVVVLCCLVGNMYGDSRFRLGGSLSLLLVRIIW